MYGVLVEVKTQCASDDPTKRYPGPKYCCYSIVVKRGPDVLERALKIARDEFKDFGEIEHKTEWVIEMTIAKKVILECS